MQCSMRMNLQTENATTSITVNSVRSRSLVASFSTSRQGYAIINKIATKECVNTDILNNIHKRY